MRLTAAWQGCRIAMAGIWSDQKRYDRSREPNYMMTVLIGQPERIVAHTAERILDGSTLSAGTRILPEMKVTASGRWPGKASDHPDSGRPWQRRARPHMAADVVPCPGMGTCDGLPGGRRFTHTATDRWIRQECLAIAPRRIDEWTLIAHHPAYTRVALLWA